MAFSLEKLVNKVAVVTGASSGIGAAIAERLVNQGLTVAGLARRVDRVTTLSTRLHGAPGKLLPFKVDITNEPGLTSTLNHVTSNLGPIHVLVNNAGISKSEKLFEISNDNVKQILDVNVYGLYLCSKMAVLNMAANDVRGHVININSISGHFAHMGRKLNVYGATKFAVTALTNTMRHEVARMDAKIKVTSISPGLTASEMTVYDTENPRRAGILKTWPIMQPEDIADGVVYVLSTPDHVQVHELVIGPMGELT